MKSPITGREMKLKVKEDVITFRKEAFTILYYYYGCEDSGEEFTDEALDNLNVVQAYNQYRAKYNLPFPDEIKEIREQYEISAAKMAEILGFGVNIYRYYESGEVPSISNARLIQLAKDPVEFRKLLIASNALAGNALEKVKIKIEELIDHKANFQYSGLPKYLMTGSFNCKPGILTGYRTPSLKRMIEMVVFFTEGCKPWKTKLNKLLFYADFAHYKRTGNSITGAKYMAIQMGPVPLNFSSLFEYADMQNEIDIAYQEIQDNIGEQFNPHQGRKFDASLFDDSELATMKEILTKFKNTSTAEMVKLSHEEKAWIDNEKEKKKISYEYAFELKYV